MRLDRPVPPRLPLELFGDSLLRVLGVASRETHAGTSSLAER